MQVKCLLDSRLFGAKWHFLLAVGCTVLWNKLNFPCGSAGKESTCNTGDLGSILGSGRSPGEGKGYPPQYSGLESSMNCIVHEVTKSRTRLSDFHISIKLENTIHGRIEKSSSSNSFLCSVA